MVKNPKRKKTIKKEHQKTARKPKKISRERYLIKRILITNFLSLIIIIATYFWMIFFLSNVNSFWDIFRKKDTITKKKIAAPTSPYIFAIPEATQESSIDISGKSVPGMKVLLYIDDIKTQETIADNSGDFSFTGIKVGLFPQKIYARASDENGVLSNKSTTYTVVLDKEPPDVEVIKPKDGEKHKSTGHSYTVKGKTEPGVSVYVNDRLAILTPSGDFSASIRLERGENEIKILAKDKAGNETEKTVHITFSKIE